MSKKGDINVLVIGSDKIPSYKIGVEQPLRYLEKRKVCQFDVRPDDLVEISKLAAADVVIFFRTVHPQAYKCLELAREMGKKTVYVIDDHFLAMPPSTDIGRYYHDPIKRETYVKFLKNAHIVKVASEFFAKHLETHFHPNQVVCFPGSVDFSVIEGLKKNKNNQDKIVIGYEGGRKEAAFEPVKRALRGIIRKYGDKVRIEFFGYAPDGLEGKPQVYVDRHFSDYKNFLKRLYQAGWDIGLAPLERTLLHDCKTNNKYREYGSCLIAGIYSLSPAYERWVTDQENGLLVSETRDDWYSAIEKMIEQPELRQKIIDRAERKAKENFSVESCAGRWHTQIFMSE